MVSQMNDKMGRQKHRGVFVQKTNSSYTSIYGLLWIHYKQQITKGEQLLFARLCYHILAPTTTQHFFFIHPGLHPVH